MFIKPTIIYFSDKIYTIDEFRCWKVENLDDEWSYEYKNEGGGANGLVVSACKLTCLWCHHKIMFYKIPRGATTTLWVTGISDPLKIYYGRLDEHDWWYAILDAKIWLTDITQFLLAHSYAALENDMLKSLLLLEFGLRRLTSKNLLMWNWSIHWTQKKPRHMLVQISVLTWYRHKHVNWIPVQQHLTVRSPMAIAIQIWKTT
jgi:hypothetical protein